MAGLPGVAAITLLDRNADQEASAADTKSIDAGAKRPEKKAAGKLPPRPSTQLKDSREAAADMLKKFLNRR